MRHTMLLGALASNPVLAETLSAEDALRHHLIQLQLLGTGGYRGECVSAKVQNNTAGDLTIFFEPGRILDNTDPRQQDIILTRKLTLQLHGGEKKEANLTGYCCQSSNSAPQKNQQFLLGKMAEPDLVNLCKYISRNQPDEFQVQNAIWTLSDHHLPASIGMPGDTSVARLFELCSRNRAVLPPWYHISYRYVPGKVFSNLPHRVQLNFQYEKLRGNELTMEVYDAEGNKMKTLLASSYADPGLRDYHLAFDVINWKHGTYSLKVIERGKEPFVKTFEI